MSSETIREAVAALAPQDQLDSLQRRGRKLAEADKAELTMRHRAVVSAALSLAASAGAESKWLAPISNWLESPSAATVKAVGDGLVFHGLVVETIPGRVKTRRPELKGEPGRKAAYSAAKAVLAPYASAAGSYAVDAAMAAARAYRRTLPANDTAGTEKSHQHVLGQLSRHFSPAQ
jgi:hypothetical protein